MTVDDVEPLSRVRMEKTQPIRKVGPASELAFVNGRVTKSETNASNENCNKPLKKSRNAHSDINYASKTNIILSELRI